MGGYIIIPGAKITSETARRIPDALVGIPFSGATHRWDSSQITSGVDLPLTSLPDALGGKPLLPLSENGNQTLRKDLATGISYAAIRRAGAAQMGTAAGVITGTTHTVAVLARGIEQPNSILSIGPAFLYKAGNGAFQILDKGKLTGRFIGNLGTGWNVIIFSISGATLAVSVNGIETPGSPVTGGEFTGTSTSTDVSTSGNNTATASTDLSLAMYWPKASTAADRLGIYQALKNAYPALP